MGPFACLAAAGLLGSSWGESLLDLRPGGALGGGTSFFERFFRFRLVLLVTPEAATADGARFLPDGTVRLSSANLAAVAIPGATAGVNTPRAAPLSAGSLESSSSGGEAVGHASWTDAVSSPSPLDAFFAVGFVVLWPGALAAAASEVPGTTAADTAWELREDVPCLLRTFARFFGDTLLVSLAGGLLVAPRAPRRRGVGLMVDPCFWISLAAKALVLLLRELSLVVWLESARSASRLVGFSVTGAGATESTGPVVAIAAVAATGPAASEGSNMLEDLEGVTALSPDTEVAGGGGRGGVELAAAVAVAGKEGSRGAPVVPPEGRGCDVVSPTEPVYC